MKVLNWKKYPVCKIWINNGGERQRDKDGVAVRWCVFTWNLNTAVYCRLRAWSFAVLLSFINHSYNAITDFNRTIILEKFTLTLIFFPTLRYSEHSSLTSMFKPEVNYTYYLNNLILDLTCIISSKTPQLKPNHKHCSNRIRTWLTVVYCPGQINFVYEKVKVSYRHPMW